MVYLYDHLVLELIRYKAVTCTMYKLSLVGMSGRRAPILKKGPFRRKMLIFYLLPSFHRVSSFLLLRETNDHRLKLMKVTGSEKKNLFEAKMLMSE